MSDDAARSRTQELARRLKDPILLTGATFGSSTEFESMRSDLGLDRWPAYFAGRGGVLGAVEPAVVDAAMGFFSPSLVASAWGEAARVAQPPRIATIDAAAFAAWGRRVLGGVRGIDRLATLAEQVVAAADAAALPLFAAWRAFANPEDHPGARAALAINRLREHRGGLHLVAVRAAGLTPLQAILASAGEDKAFANGWTGPFPNVADADQRRATAEQITDELTGKAYTTLTPSEVDELAAGLDRVGDRLRADPDLSQIER